MKSDDVDGPFQSQTGKPSVSKNVDGQTPAFEADVPWLPRVEISSSVAANTMSTREETAGLREQAADMREQTVHARESSAQLRETVVDSRETAVSEREAPHHDDDTVRKALLTQVTRLKEINKRLVIASINSKTLADELEQAKVGMAHAAHHDFLTGLPNRICLEDRLKQALASCRARGSKLALLFIDLDRFKTINDTLGHGIGDRLLQLVAQRLAKSIRASDTVSRQGGDEFIVLLSEIEHRDELVARVESLHHLISTSYNVDDHTLHIGASIGVSVFPEDGDSGDILIHHADAAMYSIKAEGRNNYAFFEQAMNDRAIARHALEEGLKNALASQQLLLHYQAQVDLESGRITGAEALLRWRHPTQGLLHPLEFVPLAEECGVIVPVGRWVLREACTQAQAWRSTGMGLELIAVNVSFTEFAAPDFLEHVLSVLDETGLPPQHLELELTESVMMKDTESTIEKFNALRSLGIRIAVDDFGTGYSSLSYLKRLPVDTLKMDKTFIAELGSSDTDDILVNAVINIGRGLKHHVIAEGIESPEQLASLRARHCAGGQGFYLSVPMTAKDFTQMLKTGLVNRILN